MCAPAGGTTPTPPTHAMHPCCRAACFPSCSRTLRRWFAPNTKYTQCAGFSGWPIPSFAGTLQPQPATPAAASEAQHSFRDVRGAREERKHQRRKVGDRKQHMTSKLQSGPIASDMQSKAKGRMKAFSKAALTVMGAGSEPLAQAILQSREKTSDSSGIPPLYPQDADKWTVEQLSSQRPVAIHNQGWTDIAWLTCSSRATSGTRRRV